MKKFQLTSLKLILSLLMTSGFAFTHVTADSNCSFYKNEETSHFQEKYSFMSKIGEGTHSTVFLSKNDLGELVAVKKYSIDDQKLIELFEQNGVSVSNYLHQLAEKELRIGQLTDHPNIVKIKEAWFESSAAYVVMEYVKGKTFNYFENYPLETRLIFMQQFLSALEHLLSRNIMVDDLWSGNILISEENGLTLIDLGGYEMIDDETHMPVGHYLDMIENMLRQIGGEASKVVDSCEDLLPVTLKDEVLSTAHIDVLIAWIVAMQTQLQLDSVEH